MFLNSHFLSTYVLYNIPVLCSHQRTLLWCKIDERQFQTPTTQVLVWFLSPHSHLASSPYSLPQGEYRSFSPFFYFSVVSVLSRLFFYLLVSHPVHATDNVAALLPTSSPGYAFRISCLASNWSPILHINPRVYSYILCPSIPFILTPFPAFH
jgi:hypothetical protein